ncbi:MAG TPA: hypothetical protein VH913_14425, partial [Hyphomicrobiaceae bacterium]
MEGRLASFAHHGAESREPALLRVLARIENRELAFLVGRQNVLRLATRTAQFDQAAPGQVSLHLGEPAFADRPAEAEGFAQPLPPALAGRAAR